MKIISLSLYTISIFLLNFSTLGVNGQISTACTSSMITTFTPCFSFITGSSGGGSSSATKNCCDSLKSFVTNNIDCACLIVTGNVPLSIPFMSQNSAISLPRMCNDAVPIQCKAIGAPLPPPGPALFAPPPPAIAPSGEAPTITQPGEAPSYSPNSPAPEPERTKASKAITLAPSPPPEEWVTEVPEASPSSELLPPTEHSRIKPVLNHKSTSSPSRYMLSPSLLILIIIAIIVLKF